MKSFGALLVGIRDVLAYILFEAQLALLSLTHISI
jgi:hypothetical protein